MNDLSEQREANFEDNKLSESISYASNEAYYKKLGAYLLLLYQAYLKKETHLEADIKMALLRMVNFNQDYAFKIRMAQLDYLNGDKPMLKGEWDEAKDVLFPIKESEALEGLNDKAGKTIDEYKNVVSQLLRSSL